MIGELKWTDNLDHIYHDKVAKLTNALNEESNRIETAEAIRALIEVEGFQ